MVIEKKFVGKTPTTTVVITGPGREAINRHWTLLDQLRRQTGEWQPPEGKE